MIKMTLLTCGLMMSIGLTFVGCASHYDVQDEKLREAVTIDSVDNHEAHLQEHMERNSIRDQERQESQRYMNAVF